MIRMTAGASADGLFRLVELAGEADVTDQHLRGALAAEAAEEPPLLVVDLTRLTYLDCWAMHALLATARDLRKAGREMALAGPFGPVKRILELSRADQLVTVHDSVWDVFSRGQAVSTSYSES